MANGNKNEGTRDGLALVVGGLFILALVFAAYNYFNKPVTPESSENNESTSIIDKIKDTFGGTEKGELNGDGAQSSTTEQNQQTPQTNENKTDVLSENASQIIWTANDYQQGDISGSEYTVVRGDTLWEIAEARYGSGLEWTKILDANSNDIGFLPSGQQALIVPGQVLNLP